MISVQVDALVPQLVKLPQSAVIDCREDPKILYKILHRAGLEPLITRSPQYNWAWHTHSANPPSVTMMTRIKYMRPKSINLVKFHFQGMHKIDAIAGFHQFCACLESELIDLGLMYLIRVIMVTDGQVAEWLCHAQFYCVWSGIKGLSPALCNILYDIFGPSLVPSPPFLTTPAHSQPLQEHLGANCCSWSGWFSPGTLSAPGLQEHWEHKGFFLMIIKMT